MQTAPDRHALSLVTLRRDLHQHPELRFEEHRTAALLAIRLREAGFDVEEEIAGTGLIASVGAPGARPHVVIRADMDAVPTADLTGVPYASVTPGVSHACGHDIHMSVVLGAGERLAADGPLPGRLTLLFQPAEEIPFGERSGARAMIEAGVLDRAPVDAVLGLHCWPGLPAGVIGLDRRVAMAAKDAFRIRLHGSAAHAATPSRGRDAILAMSQLVVSLHHVVTRQVDADERAALNIGTIRGGTSQSIVPAECEITGTVRTVDPAVRARLRSAIARLASAIEGFADVGSELDWANEMPAVVNDPRLVERARSIIPRLLGPEGLRELDGPPMTTDDFALYAERVPGLYVKLGVCGSPAGRCHSLHDGRFDPDESAIEVGVVAMVGLARDLLDRPLGSRS